MSTQSELYFADLQARGILDANHNLTPESIRKAKELEGTGIEILPFEELVIDLSQKPQIAVSPALRRFQVASQMARPGISFGALAYQCPHLFVNL